MKDVLKFVKGAVAKKDLVPVLSNFHFYNGRVQGNNGRIVIDAPCDLGGKEITVKAVPFLKAVEACYGAPNLKINDKGKLIISKKKFRSTLSLSEQDTFPRIERPDTNTWQTLKNNGLLDALKKLRPFVGEDASRPWSCGVLFKDDYAYATNNVLIARVPFKSYDLPYFNLPVFAIDELIRIGLDPDSICLTETSVTFDYARVHKGWLQSKLFDLKWPDVERFFAAPATDPIPDGLTDAVNQVLPFCPDPKFPILKLSGQGVSTADGDMSAAVDCGALPESCFRAEPLLTMLKNATHCDFKNYPKPCAFRGNGIEGVMVGVKL